MDIYYWISKMLHIETLFFIIVGVFVLYLIFSKNKKTVEQKILGFLNLVDETHEKNKIKKNVSGGGGGNNNKKKKRTVKGTGTSKGEERCREIFEGLFDKEFPSIRPDWLKNPVTKQNLELDGFCSDIRTPLGKGLAFEYDGEQHSRYNKHFHRNGPKEFVYQYKKDTLKDMICKERGILLIRIPHYIDKHDLDMYIIKRLEKFKLI